MSGLYQCSNCGIRYTEECFLETSGTCFQICDGCFEDAVKEAKESSHARGDGPQPVRPLVPLNYGVSV